jgi:hypothetical protein
MRRRIRVLCTIVLAATFAAGCDDGGKDRTGGDVSTTSTASDVATSLTDGSTTSDTTASTTAQPTTTTTARRYTFGLPGGDLSPAEFERDVYRRLRESCDAGQRELDARWSQLVSPLHVLLFQSAVHVCRGEDALGRQFFDRGSAYGWPGVRTYETVCNTYKAVRSVLEQIAPASIECPRGSPPPWSDPDPSRPRDDPRTDEDERTTTTTTPTTTTSTTSPDR